MDGRKCELCNGHERFTHWLTDTTFVVLTLTGLNLLYGRYFLLPLVGPEIFSALTIGGKYAHNFLAFGFMIGIVMIAVLWVRQNILNSYDMIWLAKGGGMFTKGTPPTARKSNDGQQIERKSTRM